MSQPLFHAPPVGKTYFTKKAGKVRENRYAPPGQWLNNERHDAYPAVLPVVTQVVDNLFAGADPSTGDWVVTVTPILTQDGVAAADAMGPASIEFEADATTLADTVLALIAEAESGASVTTPDQVTEWNRFRSYVKLSVGGTPATLRATAVAPGTEFEILVTPAAGNTTAATTVTAPSTTVIRDGFYYERTGRTELGQVTLGMVTAATDPANLVGPVMHSQGMLPVSPGYAFVEYPAGSDVSVTLYGPPLAYGEAAVAAGAVGGPVYIRHTISADACLLPGQVADAATAEAAATAAVITATPVPLDATLYAMSVTVDGVLLGTLEYTSDASATAAEIADGYRTALGLNPTISALVTADAPGASPVIFSGPADGRPVVMADVGVGDSGIVATTPAVSFHTAHPRDTFLATTQRIGSAPVNVPHP